MAGKTPCYNSCAVLGLRHQYPDVDEGHVIKLELLNVNIANWFEI
jgi:hypothetical protein